MLRQARFIVTMVFFLHGVVFANWAARIPAVRTNLGLSEGELGFTLLGISVGILIALPIVGGLIARFGSRKVTAVAGTLFCLMLIPIGLAPSAIVLWGVLLVFGMVTSSMDVAMNAQAVAIESSFQKPILSSFHAAFSIGGAFGALMGGFIAGLDIDVVPHFVFASLSLALVMVVLSRGLIDVDGETDEQDKVFSFPSRALWPLGIVAFAAAVGEGAMADWSAIFMRDVVETSEEVAAAGFFSFSLMMFVGRLLGDWLTEKFNPVLMIRLCGVLATSGLLIAISLPQTIPAVIGFGLVGAGLSIVIPLAFSRAGNLPNVPSGVGIAGVATLGYAGFLAGPPIIGVIAEETSLSLALGGVAILFSSLIFTATAVRRPVEPPMPTAAQIHSSG